MNHGKFLQEDSTTSVNSKCEKKEIYDSTHISNLKLYLTRVNITKDTTYIKKEN